MARKQQLPVAWRQLFWDVKWESLRLDRDQEFLIGRVLTEGGWSATRELRRRFGDGAIRDWIVSHAARGLTPERIRFWQLMLDISTRAADSWVRAERSSVWGQRTAT